MTASAAPALAPDLEAALRRLKLAAVRRLAPEVLVTAQTQRWTPEELLRTLLEAELAARDASNARARLRAAGFPVRKTLEEFHVAESSIPRATFDYLASLEWIRAKENLCLVGPAGTGKSHTLIALGHAAVEAGFRVRYFAAAELVETLYRGLADNTVGQADRESPARRPRHRDELGFAPLDDTGAQLLFRFVAAAYERRSLGRRQPLAVRELGPLPARAHDRGGAARPPAAPQRRGRHQRRLLPHEGGEAERRWAYGDALSGPRGWGLLMATEWGL